ncbi:threonine--tRNA ligase 1, cytoplasmic-like isoform X2 [Mercenaria mercenaria]|uniref:threonine--tRNA ligase 1, cytoplasmic-like isoform X2 n=1 Tax=Mercenaria mercenaria TaxID=6596 RepID=UPI00234F09F6|nr:threonine--tRNA ligase 1, cytoplasmic-like isoform X2 [Mercenaria mercenaria]
MLSRFSLSSLRSRLGRTFIRFSSRKGKKAKAEAAGDQGDKLTAMDPPPEFLASRQQLWDQLKKEYDDWVAAQERVSIKVTLPDGKVVEGKAWETTPYDVAKGISQGLADNTVIAKVNDVLWDLDRPLEQDAKLQLLKFDDKDGEYVFWHSSAHILGEAMECLYGGHLCYGPPIESGFYYDMWSDRQVSSNDYPVIESRVKQIVKEKQPFERLVMTKENLLKMFEYNEFKQRIINQKIDTPTTTVYKCGPLIDLCRGPHVRHTGKIKSMAVTKNSSTYWEGKADAESLQRIYGISFPDPKQMKEWKHFQEEAAKRNHRKIGQDQELFFFHELSPGSCFFLPKGAHIYNTLVDFMKSEYRKRGFHEVVSPNIYNHRLWETSGHWQHYAENMFQFDVEKEKYALKPMNCPGHCLMFDHRIRSHKELPLRMADFGVLHRNELSGALSGLTRVRRFQQDDAHIFCTPEQIEQEVLGCLEFLKFVYGVFGFTFELKLSTRPDGFLGDPALWETAEKDLATTLDKFGYKWELNPGDGAFYGPKIDITITDALRRPHQCATIQLDFQLPIRFNLGYIGASGDGEKLRPVIIHRAILGSVERMMAILCESYGGKWPFWLSPRQAIVIPVASAFDEYAMQVKQQIFDAGFLCDAELDPSNTLNKKVRNSQLAQYNFILVVGEKEVESKSANVRTRDNKVHGEHSIEKIIERFNSFKETRCLDAEEQF